MVKKMMYLLLSMAIICGSSTFGALFSYIYKEKKNKISGILNGFASGIMLAASIWSLIIPAFEKNRNFILTVVTFIFGAIIIIMLDLLPLNKKRKLDSVEKTYLAVTIHNIPEGMIVGLSMFVGIYINDIRSAFLVAVAIGIQNIPESIALSISLYGKNKSKNRSFLYTFLSGFVEPIFCFIGYAMAIFLKEYIYLFLSFAGGCMLYVVIAEMVPQSIEENKNGGKFGFLIGFVIMMILDIVL